MQCWMSRHILIDNNTYFFPWVVVDATKDGVGYNNWGDEAWNEVVKTIMKKTNCTN